MSPTSLRELLPLPGVLRLVGDSRAEAVQVSGISSDSRRVARGDLFAALSGRNVDGARFIEQAVMRGAAAVVSERELPDCPVPVLLVDDLRGRLGPLAQRLYGEPTRELCTIGVTGTNGKTTVTHLLESVLARAGHTPALLGTVALRGPLGEEAAELTTPEADRIASFAREVRDAGASHLLLEVSSVALTEQRLAGMQFQVAAFTNLTHDHLDYHGTFEAYGEAKARLFLQHQPQTSVIVVDQPFGQSLAERVLAQGAGRVLRCSVTGSVEADLRVRSFQSTRHGLTAELDTPSGPLSLQSPLFGQHNLENLLVTVGCAIAVGVDLATISAALAQAKGAPGRMERVNDRRGVLVLVDYAHTPDALSRALEALRPLTDGRLLVVFGCGGDRDRQKRAPMAEAALRGADLGVLTSDNPRTENVSQILGDMEPGAAAVSPKLTLAKLRTATRGYVVVADRAQAIAAALEAARAGDTVLLAGKGHETYQVVGNTRYAFDDRIQAARALTSLGGG
ncbi:MAG: UDP-N-acetylmuramoyl-L-alanyl-D-glutamate--2,6-diaminopimelate ligase [Myxococcaceae bacterium]|nr:UDP-N-acetylmuramoyl-L-alanyl-D-glutamate--2,6-diaminopimelate ligase [Myxococcaceae bacterium]